jgi:hypothetical protein
MGLAADAAPVAPPTNAGLPQRLPSTRSFDEIAAAEASRA